MLVLRLWRALERCWRSPERLQAGPRRAAGEAEHAPARLRLPWRASRSGCSCEDQERLADPGLGERGAAVASNARPASPAARPNIRARLRSSWRHTGCANSRTTTAADSIRGLSLRSAIRQPTTRRTVCDEPRSGRTDPATRRRPTLPVESSQWEVGALRHGPPMGASRRSWQEADDGPRRWGAVHDALGRSCLDPRAERGLAVSQPRTHAGSRARASDGRDLAPGRAPPIRLVCGRSSHAALKSIASRHAELNRTVDVDERRSSRAPAPTPIEAHVQSAVTRTGRASTEWAPTRLGLYPPSPIEGGHDAH